MVLVPDTKWDGTTSSSLYLLAVIVNPTGRRLRSIRDLQSLDVPMLRNVRASAMNAIETRLFLSAYALPKY